MYTDEAMRVRAKAPSSELDSRRAPLRGAASLLVTTGPDDSGSGEYIMNLETSNIGSKR